MNPPLKFPVPKAFRSRAAWESSLAKNHAKSNGLWLKIFKKESGKTTVSHAEALAIALCYGWIDAQRKGLDSEAFLQRFTPRRKGSIWSEINRDKVLLLIQSKKMQPSGLKAVEEAQKNGRGTTAYSPQKSATIPADFEKTLQSHPKAARFFKTLKGQNRYAIIFRIQTTRKPEIRKKKIEAFVAMLNAGKTIYPQPLSKSR